MREMTEQGCRPFFVISNGAGPSFYSSRSPDTGRVAWVASAMEAKRFDDFVEAARECDHLQNVYVAVSVVRYSPTKAKHRAN